MNQPILYRIFAVHTGGNVKWAHGVIRCLHFLAGLLSALCTDLQHSRAGVDLWACLQTS